MVRRQEVPSRCLAHRCARLQRFRHGLSLHFIWPLPVPVASAAHPDRTWGRSMVIAAPRTGVRFPKIAAAAVPRCRQAALRPYPPSLFPTCPACRLLAAGLADAKPNAPPNAKVGEASVVKSVCERDRDPNGPRRGAARDHDAALGAGSERQGPGREASGSGERSGSGRRPVEPARA